MGKKEVPILLDKTRNQINVIYPRKNQYKTWVFTDEQVGLHDEPFVLGTGEIINSIVGKRRKFVAYISKDSMPDYTGRLIKIKKKEKGWYLLDGTEMEGWLCPATLKYFEDYPDNIYFKIE